MKIKPHLATDFYKVGHKFQYPEGTEFVYSNFTARSSSHAKMSELFDDKVVFFGLQGFIQDKLINEWNEGFFIRPKEEVVNEYKRRMDTSLGKDSVDVSHIAELHDLGYLPLKLMALPEGSQVNIKVPLLTVENTNSKFYWLTNYIETALSAELWQPITSATIAYEYRRLLNKYVEETGSNKDFANWQLHDFSYRGMESSEAAAKSGAGHLVAAGFGTDTLPAIDYLEQFYFADAEKELVGGSVPATEHSIMCAGGKDDEVGTIKRIITDLYPSGIVSVVSDTWDFWNVITNTANILKEDILNRKPDALGNAKVVFRPDSGDPVKIISGLRVAEGEPIAYDLAYDDFDVVKAADKYYEFEIEYDRWDGSPCGYKLTDEIPEHVVKGAVECLWDVFGGDTTENNYKTLNQRVGLIYGDSITIERMDQILSRLKAKGFSAGNVVFGIGSFTYQYNTRDTFGMAMKSTYAVVNGEGRELFKDPITDSGTKKSAKGLIRVVNDDEGNFILRDQQSIIEMHTEDNAMQDVFIDGFAYNEQTLSEIRNRLK